MTALVIVTVALLVALGLVLFSAHRLAPTSLRLTLSIVRLVHVRVEMTGSKKALHSGK
jgi:hypothetical protein